MRLAALCAAIVVAASPVAAACSDDRVTVIGDFGRANFSVDVADDNDTRAQGLMNVALMPTMSGMLFVYERPQRATFWMRNTWIGLDMIFAAPSGEILTIHENAVPLDETVIDGGQGIQFVLEVNAGMSRRLGMKPGDVLQHPSVGPDAVAPCE